MHDLKLKKIPVKSRDKEHDVFPESDYLSFSFPSFSVNEKQMPEIKDWEQGEKYRIMIEVDMTEKAGRKDEIVRGSFDIIAYKAFKKKTIDDMSDKEFGEHLGEELSKS